MRRTIITILAALVVVGGLTAAAFATSSGSAITKPRLERSITASFSNVYAQQAALLDHKGVTPASMKAKAMCDKGPGVPQSGPGTSWNCLMSWHDPNLPMPTAGYGKFELTVHSNGCYTAGAPSTLIGYQTITDARGRTVNNPAYEWDSCFDPKSSNRPTGVKFPSALTITSTNATPDPQRHVTVGLACAAGAGGCAGTVIASADGHPLGSAPFAMSEQATKNVTLPGAVPAGAKQVTYTVKASKGVPPKDSTVPVQG